MKRDTQTTMFGIVDQWKASGLHKKVFAQKSGLTQSKLEYWIRKREISNIEESQCPSFIEISPLGSPFLESKQSEKTPTREKLQIELTFPSGLSLKIYG
jgi:hypothetical protein